MTLEFLPAAAQEVAEATAYYEETEHGLGVRFREEVQSATTAILEHPLLWRQRGGDYRRVNLAGFPYYLVTSCGGHEYVSLPLAIAHANQATSDIACDNRLPSDRKRDAWGGYARADHPPRFPAKPTNQLTILWECSPI